MIVINNRDQPVISRAQDCVVRVMVSVNYTHMQIMIQRSGVYPE